MKKRLILIFVPLLLSTSFSSYGTDKAEYAQQIMNRFQSTIKRFQKKMQLYQDCMQGKCSPEETTQAKAELKKAAKIAIPTALAITALIVTAIIKKRKSQEEVELPELTEQEMEDVKKHIKREKKEEKTQQQYRKIMSTVADKNIEGFKKEIENIFDLNEQQRIDIAWLLVKYEYKIPEKMEMLKLLFEKDQKLVNAKKVDTPLFSIALNTVWQDNVVNIFLGQENLDVRPTVIEFENLPLFRAVQINASLKDYAERILKKYTQKELNEDIERLQKSKINNKKFYVQMIKIKAKKAGLQVDE